MVQALIVYCSPAGSTRRVAHVMETTLKDLDIPCTTADVGTSGGREAAARAVQDMGKSTCLFVGSPVYANHPVPPISAFLERLPEGTGAAAVPFVTWGGASSGVALYDMGSILSAKGLRLMGAAKVMAVHSLMWRAENPVGEGRPNAADDQKIRELTASVIRKMTDGDHGKGIPLGDLDYQPAEFREELAAASLEKARGHMPQRTVHEDRCTQCGLCVEVCPTEAVELSPFPVFSDRCIFCFNCVKECPEDAIVADMSKSEKMVRSRAERFDERPRTRIFL
ncbi:MAG: EFR1 family ferrodoxin [Desulfococcus multivorans]|jgi:ferredoxin/NAD(P)H-dependent FMN reductase|uniref:EFR1 family ferrodoxin n=1 Tax=Desulfococcus sp. TaxID=2025834 RepID=UPI002A3AEB54|nr:EFR1 family ferrodoxin [Desulfococcus multivorans]